MSNTIRRIFTGLTAKRVELMNDDTYRAYLEGMSRHNFH